MFLPDSLLARNWNELLHLALLLCFCNHPQLTLCTKSYLCCSSVLCSFAFDSSTQSLISFQSFWVRLSVFRTSTVLPFPFSHSPAYCEKNLSLIVSALVLVLFALHTFNTHSPLFSFFLSFATYICSRGRPVASRAVLRCSAPLRAAL